MKGTFKIFQSIPIDKKNDSSLAQTKKWNTSYIPTERCTPIERTLNFLTKEGKKSRASSLLRKTLLIVSKKVRDARLMPRTKQTTIREKFLKTNIGTSTKPPICLKSFKADSSHDISKETRPALFPALDTVLLLNGNNSMFFISNTKVCIQEKKTLNLSLLETHTSMSPFFKGAPVKSVKDFDVYAFFSKSLDNIKPVFEVKKVRVAGSTRQVPSLVSLRRQESLAIRWVVQAAKERKKKNATLRFEECFAFEIIEAYKKQGVVRQKRNDLHKLAEANRTFSHYRWW